VFTSLKAGADFRTGKMLIRNWNKALSFALIFKLGIRRMTENPAHPCPLIKE